ncbi:unnamed protein product [Medioppia subpectinata]|uniref:Uncharacterized protein n=1 Tax=Medioppia subpectinata TaxID=1979941 RepID=A0A7R9KQA8_9ACAR|nr:unnamed protein product [Medioppia subpectinata]CAG2107837.1 unnamed protein product [Medioppia subpectinata]
MVQSMDTTEDKELAPLTAAGVVTGVHHREIGSPEAMFACLATYFKRELSPEYTNPKRCVLSSQLPPQQPLNTTRHHIPTRSPHITCWPNNWSPNTLTGGLYSLSPKLNAPPIDWSSAQNQLGLTADEELVDSDSKQLFTTFDCNREEVFANDRQVILKD